MPGRREAHAMAWMAIAAGLILCAVSVLLGFQGRTFLGRPLGGDFVQFYTIGKILNTLPHARIYDLELAVRMQHEALPSMAQTQMLVFSQAPYIGWLFRPFALLPYAWAYVAWLGFSATIYVVGLRTLFGALDLSREDRKTGYLLALSWAPFLFETWIGGQMAAVIFFIWALFFWCLENDRRFLAGVALSLCLFKPTLVGLPALVLLAGRKWRSVAGFGAGSLTLAAISFATVGREGLGRWAGMLEYSAQFTAQRGDAWNRAKYVDLAAFFHLLLGTSQVATTILLLCAGLVVAGFLGRVCWITTKGSTWKQLWASTLFFTLVVNAYAPIYDVTLAVAAVALLASTLPGRPEAEREGFGVGLLLLYMVPWLTQSFAEFLHIQLITLVLAGFGVWSLRLVYESTGKVGALRMAHPKTVQEESTITRQLQPRAAGRL